MVTEFIAAVNQICAERNIVPEKVYTALEEAVLAAYKKEFASEESDVVVELNQETGVFNVIVRKQVVDSVENEHTEISLKDAQAMEANLEVGDTVEIEQNVDEYGRIAAQTAKQVVMQAIREAERDAILDEYSSRVGEIFTGLMSRMQRGEAVLEIGKATVFMAPEDQIGSEFYRVGDRYKVMLKEIKDTPRGKVLMVTRSAPSFLKELFKVEVPEIESGVVEVKACAREAGSRSKMAVHSNQDGVDPIGSCVGQRGIRIANVMAELGDEKIDIVEWREDPAEFVEKALSPAQVISVEIDGDTAIVTVEEDQLSLAIGKDGQNVRLAAKLTGFKVDIRGPQGKLKAASQDVSVKTGDMDDVEGDTDTAEAGSTDVDEKIVAKLESAGVTVEEARDMSEDDLLELDGIGKVTAGKIMEELSR